MCSLQSRVTVIHIYYFLARVLEEGVRIVGLGPPSALQDKDVMSTGPDFVSISSISVHDICSWPLGVPAVLMSSYSFYSLRLSFLFSR